MFAAREPVSIPGNPGQGVLPRLCLPLRAEDQLLGFLWLIDEPALTAGQTAQAQAAAAQAAYLLAQRAIRADGQFAVLTDLADGLLDDREQVRQEAAAMLTGQEALTGPPPYALAVIRPVVSAGGSAPGQVRGGRAAATLRRAAANLRRGAAPGSLVLASPREHEFVGITAAGARAGLRRAVLALPGPPLAVGTCAGTTALAEVAASLENARYAAYVTARVPCARPGRRLGRPRGLRRLPASVRRPHGTGADLPRRQRPAGPAGQGLPGDAALLPGLRRAGPAGRRATAHPPHDALLAAGPRRRARAAGPAPGRRPPETAPGPDPRRPHPPARGALATAGRPQESRRPGPRRTTEKSNASARWYSWEDSMGSPVSA